MKLWEAKVILRRFGVTITPREGGEFRVNLDGGAESTAYYSDDLLDAVGTGIAMSDVATIQAKAVSHALLAQVAS